MRVGQRLFFEPREFIDTQFTPLEGRLDRLVVLRNTVVKRLEIDSQSHRILAITAIQRTPKPVIAWDGCDQLPSRHVPDWYRSDPFGSLSKSVF